MEYATKNAERPTVVRVHKGRTLVRRSRGFSSTELKAASIDLIQARRFQLPIDTRRKTLYESNVSRLKRLISGSQPQIQHSNVAVETQ